MKKGPDSRLSTTLSASEERVAHHAADPVVNQPGQLFASMT